MIALVVSKKQLSRAVDRNLVRRRIRVVLLKIRPDWRRLSGKIFATKAMLKLPWVDLEQEVAKQLNKIKAE